MSNLTRRQLLSAAAASGAALAVGVARPLPAQAAPISTRLHPDWVLLLRGGDMINGPIVAADLTSNTLRQSADWAATWSAPKLLPPACMADGATRVVTFGGDLYCAVHDLDSLSLRVYASPPADGDTPFDWNDSGLVTQVATSAKSGTQLTHDGTYLYVGEYGDPPNGPNIYRSADGATWETVFSASDQLALIGRTCRHVHAIAPDPFAPGHVYVTTGDFGIATGAALWRSTSYGDPGTWEVVLPTGTWQSSQISFDADLIWLAADNHVQTALVLQRDSSDVSAASPTHHYDIPVPGGAPGMPTFRSRPTAMWTRTPASTTAWPRPGRPGTPTACSRSHPSAPRCRWWTLAASASRWRARCSWPTAPCGAAVVPPRAPAGYDFGLGVTNGNLDFWGQLVARRY
jgi:hypothetical protein